MEAKRTGEFKDGDVILVDEVEYYDFNVDEEAVLDSLDELAFDDVSEVTDDWPSSYIQTKKI